MERRAARTTGESPLLVHSCPNARRPSPTFTCSTPSHNDLSALLCSLVPTALPHAVRVHCISGGFISPCSPASGLQLDLKVIDTCDRCAPSSRISYHALQAYLVTLIGDGGNEVCCHPRPGGLPGSAPVLLAGARWTPYRRTGVNLTIGNE